MQNKSDVEKVIPLKPEHIPLAPDIIKNPYKIFVSPHKTGQGNIAVVYKKKIGNFFVYLEEVRKSSKELAFKTMYIKQSEVGSFAPEGAALLRSSEKQIPNPSETSFSIPPKVKVGRGSLSQYLNTLVITHLAITQNWKDHYANSHPSLTTHRVSLGVYHLLGIGKKRVPSSPGYFGNHYHAQVALGLERQVSNVKN